MALLESRTVRGSTATPVGSSFDSCSTARASAGCRLPRGLVLDLTAVLFSLISFSLPKNLLLSQPSSHTTPSLHFALCALLFDRVTCHARLGILSRSVSSSSVVCTLLSDFAFLLSCLPRRLLSILPCPRHLIQKLFLPTVGELVLTVIERSSLFPPSTERPPARPPTSLALEAALRRFATRSTSPTSRRTPTKLASPSCHLGATTTWRLRLSCRARSRRTMSPRLRTSRA